MPFQNASKASVGGGSSTGSTTAPLHRERPERQQADDAEQRQQRIETQRVSCAAHLALEHLQAMRLDAHEVRIPTASHRCAGARRRSGTKSATRAG